MPKPEPVVLLEVTSERSPELRAWLERQQVEVLPPAADGQGFQGSVTHLVALSGPAATSSLREPPIGVGQAPWIVLADEATPELILAAARLGASGYVLFNRLEHDLPRALHAAASGEAFLSGNATQVLLKQLKKEHVANQPPASVLTPREREVLILLAEGLSSRTMAEQLGVAHKTIETHRRQIMNKLDLHNIAKLTRYAIRVGLVS